MAALALPVWEGCGQANGPPARRTRGDAAGKIQEVEIEGDKLKTGLAPADAELLARVKAALASDPRLRSLPIEADAESGRVSLWGKVASAGDRVLAEQRVRQARGVSVVTNLIQVEGTERPAAGRPRRHP